VCIQKKFVVYKNVGVQRKAFLIDGDGCIVFANIKNETKRKKKKGPRRSACYGHRKHKSFVESKHIFWKQETGVKSLFSGITKIRMDGFIKPMKEHNLAILGLLV